MSFSFPTFLNITVSFLSPHLFNLSLNSCGFYRLLFVLAMNELLAQQFALVGT